jgi:ketopantoate reductase
MLQRCMEEVAAVARARGIQLDDTVVTDTMRYVDSLGAKGTTSLQGDIAEGSPRSNTGTVRWCGKDGWQRSRPL